VKKKVVFRMIGSHAVGMGHIYRTLSLSEELKSHELLFITDTASDLAISCFSSKEGWLGAFREEELTSQILASEPHMVILDVLDTDKDTVLVLKQKGVLVVSFEDLGSGSAHTTLTINELFDTPALAGHHYRWGRDYFFVRDEFLSVAPRLKPHIIRNLLLTFGGVDQHNLSQKILLQIRELCYQHEIQVHIVTGPGYQGQIELQNIVGELAGISLTHATGVISKIMADADLAISSNGRTVYELAHMNVPGIVIDQHSREGTHHFARPENGFVNLGLYNPGVTERELLKTLSQLITDQGLHGALYDGTVQHTFSKESNPGIIEIKNLLM